MAIPLGVPRLKIVLYGTLSANQTWSCGFNMVNTSGTTVTPTQSQLDGYAEGVWTNMKLAANLGKLTPYATAACLFQGVRAYYIPANTNKAAYLGQSSSASLTGAASSAQQHPNQAAIVATHVGSSLGRTSTGRVYLPLQGASMISDGTFQPTATPNIALGWANVISMVNATRLATVAYVASTVSTKTGTSSAITAVRVDNVYDTVRARRDKVIATSKSQVVTVIG